MGEEAPEHTREDIALVGGKTDQPSSSLERMGVAESGAYSWSEGAIHHCRVASDMK